MKKSVFKDVMIIGFALFAMFFGAGNLIFPGALGHAAGDQWPLALLATVLVGIFLPILAVVAVANVGKDFKAISKPVGTWYYHTFNFLSLIGIFAVATLPRTAATTHEIAVAPLFPDVPIGVTVPIFFLIALLLALDKSSLVDRIGKYLTPGLLVLLLIVIVKGLITPLGTPAATGKENVFGSAFQELYATGDLIAGHFFSGIIIAAVLAKGYKEGREQKRITVAAAAVACVLFIAVYAGLLIISAGAGEVIPQGTDKTFLLSEVVRRLLGTFGSVSLALAVGLACISTAVTLLSLAANYLSDLTKNKLSYRAAAILLSIFASLFGSLGVENILKLSGPCFLAIYPSAIVLTFAGLLANRLPNIGVYRYSVAFSLGFGILDAIYALGFAPLGKLLRLLPWYGDGFGWILPTLVGALLGYFLHRDRRLGEPALRRDREFYEILYAED